MKNIALMTWYHYNNYGTVLQVYALSEIVKELGYDPSVINYIPNDKHIWTIEDMLKNPAFFTNKIIMKIKRTLKIYNNLELEKDKLFDLFREQNIKLTCSCQTSSELYALNDQFDAFICGSDQIWAPTVYNPKYFLDFVNEDSKIIAYAPSIGMSSISNEYVKENMKQHIQRFKYLSVREDEGSKIIYNLTGQQAKVVLDPTLLISKEKWNSLISSKVEIKAYNKPYLLCYFLGQSKKNWESACSIARILNLEILVIPVHEKDYKSKFKTIEGVGPNEFLTLFSKAEFICTDSFHGTIFSIINEKAFVTYKRFSDTNKTSQNSRIYNILSLLELESQLYSGSDKDSIENAKRIDYKAVNKLLTEKREESIEYLKKSLIDSVNSKLPSEYQITNTCCGCSTCKAICPKDAISITLDETGFLQAKIDKNNCIKCGKCESVCPFNGKAASIIKKENDKLFMGRSKSTEVLCKSSSGGIAFEISKYCCENGYDIIGCTYDNENRIAKHKRIIAGDLSQIYIFQGSKYLQSHFEEIINDVAASRKTVIFGTPCQIAGIDNLLRVKENRYNYVLVDLICHGVPSHNLWQKYLDEINKEYHCESKPNVEFRYKQMGWRKMHIKVSSNDNIYINSDTKDAFFRFFKSGNCYANSCYECNYRTASCADIRLGDYWGEKYKKDNKGVSMVLTLSQKGEMLLESLHKNNAIDLEQNNIDDYWNIQLPYNPKKPLFYEHLLSNLKNNDSTLKVLANKYCKQYEQSQVIYKIAGKCKLAVKKLIG